MDDLNLEGGSGRLLDAIVSAFPEPLFVLDRAGNYLAVLGGGDSQRYHDGSGLVGKRLHDVMDRDIADAFLEQVHLALDTGKVIRYAYELGGADVEGVKDRSDLPGRLCFEGHVAPIPQEGEAPEMVVWLAFNITQLKRALEELEAQREALARLARTDPLTGVGNRRSFFEALERERRQIARTGQPASVIVFDLDEFKAVNDEWGHAAGDAVLAALATLFGRHVRSSDALARLGGEEFALVLHNTDLDRAVTAAERIRAELEATVVEHEGNEIRITMTGGVTRLCASEDDVSVALGRADRALYGAKRAGRNRIGVDG